MSRGAWLVCVAGVAAQAGLIGFVFSAAWSAADASQQAALISFAQQSGGLMILGGFGLIASVVGIVWWMTKRYVSPLLALAEEVKVIAVSNPRHRVDGSGGRELAALQSAINLLAERFQLLGEEVEVRIQETSAALEEEKNTLAALMAKLTQGVLVCNRDGRILLYNRRAQALLEGPARATGGGDWIGLGRSLFSIIDERLVRHALSHVEHRLAESSSGEVLVPFLVSRPGGQHLSSHLVPILDHERHLRGYILTLEDITRRVGSENRRGVLLQSLTEGQRSAIAGVRAAVETVLSFPDLDEEGRLQFLEVIRDEAVKMSAHLDQLEQQYSGDLTCRWPLEDMLASDFLAAAGRAIREARDIDVEVSAPVEPVWLKVDAYGLTQCLIFVTDQLRQSCRAESLTLTLEQRRGLAALELEWSGAMLHMEALRTWGLRNVSTEAGGAALSLFEAIERHGGALWPDRGRSGRPCLRLVLPVSDAEAQAVANGEGGDDFDFHLFDERTRTTDPRLLPLTRLTCTVVDTETTGLDPTGGDEIIAIGAVRVVNGRILHREIFDSFVRPRRPISAEAQAIHGISAEMLRAEPPIDDVLPRLARFVEDTVLVGHNISFDLRFFEIQGKNSGIRFTNPAIDTLVLECLFNPNQEDKSLEGIAARLGINVTGRHTALGDALTTAEVFLSLIPQLAEHGIRTLGDVMAACEQSRLSQIRY